MGKPDLQHVRRPAPFWRDEAEYTECGRLLSRYDDDRIIAVEELVKRVRDWGKQRTSFSTCMTCWQTVERWSSHLDDPILIAVRELDYVKYRGYEGDLAHVHPETRSKIEEERAKRDRVTRELQAIKVVIEAHRAEFDEAVAGLGDVDDLGARRRDAQAKKRRPHIR